MAVNNLEVIQIIIKPTTKDKEKKYSKRDPRSKRPFPNDRPEYHPRAGDITQEARSSAKMDVTTLGQRMQIWEFESFT